MVPRWLIGTLLLSCGAASVNGADNPNFKVPPGFEVTLFADDNLAHDIYSMTIDAKGRIAVAGPNYVKLLVDKDQDGLADEAILFSDKPASGAHGLLFDGNDLIYTGDNGVWKVADTDGDGKADGKPVQWAKLRHPEHGANGLTRGPDGRVWLICGNDAGVTAALATAPGSPIKTPSCGAVIAFSQDGKQSTIFADGFRNPYDLTFTPGGQVYTVDSDGEREHQLPWYTPTRLFDIGQGRAHGWLMSGWTRSWNRPAYFYDNVERVAELGRGSPTGLEVYQHDKFPDVYRQGVFSCCWTFGRVYFMPLQPTAGTFTAPVEVFMQSTGNNGFAPVDLAVDPAGDLYVAIGGRGTRGGVYRVRYVGQEAKRTAALSDVDLVLSAPQPLASWSRAQWLPRAKKLGQTAFEEALINPNTSAVLRARAVEVLVDVFGELRPEVAAQVADAKPELVARAAWGLTAGKVTPAGRALLSQWTKMKDPLVGRAVWEAIAALPTPLDNPSLTFTQVLTDGPPRARWAAMLAARQNAAKQYEAFSQTPAGKQLAVGLAAGWIESPQFDAESKQVRQTAQVCLDVLEHEPAQDRLLEAVRLVQVTLGDLRTDGTAEIYSGYQGAAVEQVPEDLRDKLGASLARRFGTGSEPLDSEIARTLGMLQTQAPGLLEKLAGHWTAASTPYSDIHYLIVLSRLPGERAAEVTKATAHALAGLHDKYSAMKASPRDNWPLRMREVFDLLVKRDAGLPAAMVEDPAFGRVEHTLFAQALKGEQKLVAARKIIAAVKVLEEDAEEPVWTSELILLAGDLPQEESLEILRSNWTDPGLQDAIASILVKLALADDRPRLVQALSSTQPNIVQQAAQALVKLPAPGTPLELVAGLKALKQALSWKQGQVAAPAVEALLQHWTGGKGPQDLAALSDPNARSTAWFKWFGTAHPMQAALLSGFGGNDPAGWRDRMAKINWDTADLVQGRKVFELKQCHRCHTGTSRLGPDLAGAAQRFSREDLLAAIVDPSREVSPTYQTTIINTKSGQVYIGMKVYASPDGTLLRTGPDTTIRVTGEEVQAERTGAVSLMPMGLLNDVSDTDLANLFAYLKTLKAQ